MLLLGNKFPIGGKALLDHAYLVAREILKRGLARHCEKCCQAGSSEYNSVRIDG